MYGDAATRGRWDRGLAVAGRAAAWAGLFAVALYAAVYCVAGRQAHLTLHDSLDGFNIATLVQSGKLYARNDAVVEQFFNGIPRSCLPSEWSATTVAFQLLPPLAAIIACKLVAIALAFAGMYALLRRHVLREAGQGWLCVAVASCFATLPTFFVDLSSAAVSLMLCVFLDIRAARATVWDWLLVVLLPFFTSFVLMGFFGIVSLGVLFLYDVAATRKIRLAFPLALSLYVAASLCVEYRLVLQLFAASHFVSHRVEFRYAPTASLLAVLDGVRAALLRNDGSLLSLKNAVVVPVLCVSCFFLKKNPRLRTWLFLLLGFIAGTALLNGLLLWQPVFDAYTSLISRFPLQLRFSWMYPALWFVAFAAALAVLGNAGRWPRLLAVIAIPAQLVFNMAHHEHRIHADGPSYEAYFAQDQFAAIRDYIGLPPSTYRVVSVALFPAVASFNGFYTLDGYFSTYPLSYKKRFREIIAPELAKSERATEYFDGWGSRVYIFPAELFPSYIRPKKTGTRTIRLDLNYDKLYAMGCRYIISATPLNIDGIAALRFLRKFDDDRSYWTIYLYQIVR